MIQDVKRSQICVSVQEQNITFGCMMENNKDHHLIHISGYMRYNTFDTYVSHSFIHICAYVNCSRTNVNDLLHTKSMSAIKSSMIYQSSVAINSLETTEEKKRRIVRKQQQHRQMCTDDVDDGRAITMFAVSTAISGFLHFFFLSFSLDFLYVQTRM